MSFAEDFREFTLWKNTLSDSPDAWEAHRALVAKAEDLDALVEIVATHDTSSASTLRDSVETYLIERGYLDVDFRDLPF